MPDLTALWGVIAISTGNVLNTLTALQRDFPRWAMWRGGDGTWSATRTPGGQAPSPGSWLIWVRADSVEQLVAGMREADEP